VKKGPFTTSITIIVVATSLFASADSAIARERAYDNSHPLSRLKRGGYMPAVRGCDGLGGAGSTTFDGKNMSFHDQLCKTIPVPNVPNRYMQHCLEGQAANFPKMSDIDNSPNSTFFEMTVLVKSRTVFELDKELYKYCGGL
jgi:hypothetical protein